MTDMRERLWNLLDKTRFEYHYFQEYRQKLARWHTAFVAFTAIVSLSIISVSLTFGMFPVVWGLLLFACGIASILFDKMTVIDRLAALRYYIPELGRQLDVIEADWVKVNDMYEYDDVTIGEMYNDHTLAISKLGEKYLDGLDLSGNKGSIRKASEVTAYLAEKLS